MVEHNTLHNAITDVFDKRGKQGKGDSAQEAAQSFPLLSLNLVSWQQNNKTTEQQNHQITQFQISPTNKDEQCQSNSICSQFSLPTIHPNETDKKTPVKRLWAPLSHQFSDNLDKNWDEN